MVFGGDSKTMDLITIFETIQQAQENLYAHYIELKNSGKKIIFTQCDIVPYEVLFAHDLVVSKLPQWVITALQVPYTLKYAQAIEYVRLADAIIVPQYCTILPNELMHQLPIYIIPKYEGFAEDAALNIHTILYSLLQNFGIKQEYPDEDKLRNTVIVYEEIRKIMRTLTSMYADEFTTGQLQLLCDVSFSLIPQQSVQLLGQLNKVIQSSQHSIQASGNKALVYADFDNWTLCDVCKEYNISVVEDDCCNGRRQFDISCNISAQNMYYELLYAYSFKSWCPGMRNCKERVELIYKALPNYDIKIVLLIQSFLTSRNAHMQSIYEHCLLQGTDAIIINPEKAHQQLNVYSTLLNKRPNYTIQVDF